MQDTEDQTVESPEDAAPQRADSRKELARDLIGFVGTVIAVSVFDWKAKDLIWGLWICSLTFGYTTILVAIFAPAVRAGGGAGLTMAFGGLFLLAFFTVHFGGFHIGHGVFLNAFFPLIGEGGDFPNPFQIIGVALALYWPMVLATFVSRFSDLPFDSEMFRASGPTGDVKTASPLIKPYVNVIRMHILIFVFAFMHGLKLGNLAIYPVLLFYFFPWRAFFANRKKA